MNSGVEDKVRAVLKKMKGLTPKLRDDITAEIQDCLPQKKDRVFGVAYRLIFSMDSKQLRDAAEEGVTIGGHTHTHTILSKMSDSEAEKDIKANKAKARVLDRQAMRFFCLPKRWKWGFQYQSQKYARSEPALSAHSLLLKDVPRLIWIRWIYPGLTWLRKTHPNR